MDGIEIAHFLIGLNDETLMVILCHIAWGGDRTSSLKYVLLGFLACVWSREKLTRYGVLGTWRKHEAVYRMEKQSGKGQGGMRVLHVSVDEELRKQLRGNPVLAVGSFRMLGHKHASSCRFKPLI